MPTFVARLATVAVGQQPAVVRLTTDGHLKQRPVWSPDGKSLLFTRHQGATIFLYVLTVEDKTERRLTMAKDPEFDAVYSPDGKRIAFSYDKSSPNQGDIDVNACLADGTEIKVVAGTEGKLSHEEWPSWSPDGQWIAYSSTKDDNQEIYVARSGRQREEAADQRSRNRRSSRLVPDGKKIAFSTSRWGDLELAVMNADGSELVRLTKSPGMDDYPCWSPDGKRLAFTSNRDGNLEIYTIDPDGQNPRNETQNPPSTTSPPGPRTAG